ncbi:TldD/PmbA family protein [Acetobacter oeni]|uniref:Modulator protein n=1 Tax=Acetobacter oeni TaxID=304077 RepID=A0A511XJK6_9PROT|nr:TldD/PmbA family protein [Acetobacter oeni]MBB3883352.1 PmbA protein [Acetobacter oeni]NHO19480.1 TldD/PmbA family protein [Acetobacter oeni]GBR00765.1 zinc-dependent microcin-processing U62/PmbA/TldD [Acetobacter oeni LMG 21952]GEN63133.1 modulator protein [Acetobacter oeni]
MSTSPLDLASDLVNRARKKGADAADAVYIGSTSLGVGVRNGTTEELERSETTDLGLRVFRGKRSAIVSTSTLDHNGFDALVDQALAMAQVLPEDSHVGLPDGVPLIGHSETNSLDLVDAAEPDAATLLERARTAENMAKSVEGITNSGGAHATWGRSTVALASSSDVAGCYSRTNHSVSMSALAGHGTGMQRDYDYHSTVWLSDLDAPETIGASAARKAVARLNPVRPRTGTFPVIFDPRIASSFLGYLSSAISGASVARGTSFLKARMGESVFPTGVTVTDDPSRLRGLRSRPFDAEGVAGQKLDLIQNGILQSWLLDSRSARQLGMQTNGRATRGPSSPPTPAITNLFFQAGTASPAELMSDISEGLYITEMMGSAVNMLTGDYSRGASGFMIRNGQIAEPIAEFTVAGNLSDMFGRLQLANDLVFRFGVNAPTVRIDALSIAGN